MHEPYCPCANCQSARDRAFPVERFGALPRFAADAAPTEELGNGRRLMPPATCAQKLKRLSVAVVGGGFAGLMAARTLCRNDIEVKVFEAGPQVGGRVLSDRGRFSKGRITEFGAELVGSIHTRWCALAAEYGLGLISRMDGELYYGQQLNEKLTLDKELSRDEIRALEKDKKDRVLLPIAKLASRITDASRPWDDDWLKVYDGLSVAEQLAKPTNPNSPNEEDKGYGVNRNERLWKAMEMGDAVKFFSEVKDRFWLETRHAPYGGSLALGQVWEGTDNQTRIGDQAFVLSVFAGGRSPMPTEKDFKRELKKLYRKYPDKPGTHFANWPRQPFIMAGIVSPGKNQIFGVGRLLNEPYLDRIFFAGDHTQMNHFGYMEGALRSGERAAELLMRRACNRAPLSPAKPPVLVASAARKREAELPW